MMHTSFADRSVRILTVGGLVAVGLLVSACGSETADEPASAAEISSEEIRGGVHLFQGAGSNVLALADGDDLLVIDGGLAENSDALIRAIRSATGGETIATLIDTHWHPEQVGLNAQAASDGATIIAHEQTCMFLSHAVRSPLYDDYVQPIDEAARPTTCSRTGGELDFAGHRVAYGYLPAAHTNGDYYVYFPELDVLAAGGAVGSDSWPLLDYWNGAFIGGLMQAYEKLGDMVSDDTVVIPAHGRTMTGAELKADREMYRQLYRDFAYMMNDGMGYDDVVAINPLHEYEDRFGDPSRFLDGAYRSKQMTEVPD